MEMEQWMTEFFDAMKKAVDCPTAAGAKSYFSFMTNFGNVNMEKLDYEIRKRYKRKLITWKKSRSFAERVLEAYGAALDYKYIFRPGVDNFVPYNSLTLGWIYDEFDSFSKMFQDHLRKTVMNDKTDKIKKQMRLEQILHFASHVKIVFMNFLQWQRENFEGEN